MNGGGGMFNRAFSVYFHTRVQSFWTRHIFLHGLVLFYNGQFPCSSKVAY